LGFDKADELYDTGDAWSEMREMFKKRSPALAWRAFSPVLNLFPRLLLAERNIDSKISLWSQGRVLVTIHPSSCDLCSLSLIEKILSEQLTIKLAHFSHLEVALSPLSLLFLMHRQGAPSQVVSQLMLKAYEDNYDYFYQVILSLSPSSLFL
jgi:hypothetical protein